MSKAPRRRARDEGTSNPGAAAAEGEAESLQESEERFRTLVEYAPEALLILDADSGRFVDVNSNACRLFGLSRQELLQRGPGDVSPELQPDGSRSADVASAWIEQAIDGRHLMFEWIHVSAGGESIPCEVRLVRLPHKGHRRLRASVIDISERKAAEAERERLTMELAQAQKLQAIGQLTGGIAHDFNNLLTVIMSSVELIEHQADDADKVGSLARQATAATQRAATLTQRLLAIARRQPLRPQVVDVNELLAGLEGLLRRTLGANITIATRPDAGVWRCQVDPAQLENVVLNLVINARDAMPNGGHLRIETANATLGRGYAKHQDEVAPGDYVMIAVSDNGTGMDPQLLAHVFEPFFSTKETGRGSGLGLSTAHGFVKQSGGDVRIASKPGRGTTVRVYLPRSHLEPTRESEPAAGESTPQGDGRLVLVVEDEPAVRALVRRELESLGYATVEAADADAAMAVLAATPSVTLVLTDVVLPGMNGPELVRQIRAERPSLPALLMSGFTESATLTRGVLDPDILLLQKPFTRRGLAQAIHATLNSTSRRS